MPRQNNFVLEEEEEKRMEINSAVTINNPADLGSGVWGEKVSQASPHSPHVLYMIALHTHLASLLNECPRHCLLPAGI